MSLEHEKEQENAANQPQRDTAPSSVSPVIAWEQPVAHISESAKTNVISIETFRRQDATPIETEATVTVRELISYPNEAPYRLIIVSSGFGQKVTIPATTIHCKAA